MSMADALERVEAAVPETRTLRVASLVVLHLLAFGAVLLADVDAFWVDERVAYDLVTGYTALELLVDAPAWPPHYPTWFVLADVVGLEAAIWLSRLSLPALVYPTYRLGERYAGEDAGHQAAFLVAMSPYLAAQAGWLRMYGLLTALLTWGLWLALEGARRRALALFAMAAIVHPFGAFGALWFALSHARRRVDRRTLALVATGLLPLVATLAYIVSQQGLAIGPTGVVHGIAPGALRIVLTPATALAGSPHNLVQVSLLLVGTALLATGDHDRELVAWVLLPLVALTVVSYVVAPIYRVKYYGFTAPAVAVLLAGLDRNRWIRAAAGACFGAALLLSWMQRLEIPAIVARRFIFWF